MALAHLSRRRSAAIVGAALAFSVATPASADDDGNVEIRDPFLGNCISQALGRPVPNTAFTRTDLESLTHLECHVSGLSSLAGLEAAVNLTSLDLSASRIIDIAPLSSLTSLTNVDLSGTDVYSIDALQDLPALTTLDISESRVRSLESIPAMQALTTLEATWLQLSDVAPLASSSLTSVNLDSNAIADLSPLASRPGLVFTARDQHISLSYPARCTTIPTPTTTDVNGATLVATGGEPHFTPVDGGHYAVSSGWAYFAFSSPSSAYSGAFDAYAIGSRDCGWLTTPTVTVSGEGNVVSPFVASAGALSPQPTDTHFTWYTATGKYLGEGNTYDGRGADLGSEALVVVRAYRTGMTTATVTSAPTTVTGAFAQDFRFTMSSVPMVGTDATVVAGAFPSVATLTCTWKLNGATVAKGTSCQYRIPTSAAGKKLALTVTATAPHYRTTTYDAGSATVLRSLGSMKTVASISGSRDIGKRLTVTPATFPYAPSSHLYQWLRDGAPITGATTSSYVLTRADGGHKVSVNVTARRSGCASFTYRTSATTIHRAFSAPTTTISGTPRVGTVVYAKRGTWTPSPTTIRYQWYRDGKAISGSTLNRRTLTSGDAGHKITVKVTGSRSGYTTKTVVSAAITVRR